MRGHAKLFDLTGGQAPPAQRQWVVQVIAGNGRVSTTRFGNNYAHARAYYNEIARQGGGTPLGAPGGGDINGGAAQGASAQGASGASGQSGRQGVSPMSRPIFGPTPTPDHAAPVPPPAPAEHQAQAKAPHASSKAAPAERQPATSAKG